jgi:hypothetical protein
MIINNNQDNYILMKVLLNLHIINTEFILNENSFAENLNYLIIFSFNYFNKIIRLNNFCLESFF